MLTVRLRTSVPGQASAQQELPLDCWIANVREDGAATLFFSERLAPDAQTTSVPAAAGRAYIDNRGHILIVDHGERADLGRLLADWADPLPRDPVGVGGRWLVTRVLAEDGESIEQRSTYELVAFSEQRAQLRVRRVQRPLAASAVNDPWGPNHELVSQGELAVTFGRALASGYLQMRTRVGPPDNALWMTSRVEFSEQAL